MAKKLLLLFSLILTVLVPLSTHTVFANPLVSSEVEPEIFVGDYQQKLEEWNNTNLLNTSSFKKKIIAKEIFGGSLVLKEDSFDYEEDVVLVQTDETITFTLDINLTGLYQMAIDFYSLSDDYLDMELAVKVNGSLLYDEAGQIVVYKHWKQSDGFSLDRYGNDFYGEQIQENKWIHQDFYDPMGLFLEPLAFYLEEGSQEISFTVIKGKMLIGNIDISGRKALISYEDYSDTAELIEDEILIENEAEIPDYKNAASIQAGVSRSVGVTPFSVKYLKLNTISGGSYNSQREMVAYRVE
ncbi:MAG: hypothetical protein PHW21_03505, partial [Candidatus Izemoplasmatales bacterium]|nr:hypothetical protein [Candidatus Izemoplasmatales bacterium]